MKAYWIILSLCFLNLSACSTQQRVVEQGGEVTTVIMRETINELQKEPVPGTVNEVWLEPMYDQVYVPGALDPKGNYYRKGHNTIVEIRQEKYQAIEYPDYNGKYAVPERPRGRMR